MKIVEILQKLYQDYVSMIISYRHLKEKVQKMKEDSHQFVYYFSVDIEQRVHELQFFQKKSLT